MNNPVLARTLSMGALSRYTTILRIAGGRAAQGATTFTLESLVNNLAEMVGGQKKTIMGVLTDAKEAANFGAGLGLVGTIANPLLRIPAEATYGFMSAKMEGATNQEAAINAAAFAIFGLFNTKNLSGAYKEAAHQGAKDAIRDRLMAGGKDKNTATMIADRFMRYVLHKGGAMRAGEVQWDKISSKDFDALSAALRRNGKIILDGKGYPKTDVTPTSNPATDLIIPGQKTPVVPAPAAPVIKVSKAAAQLTAEAAAAPTADAFIKTQLGKFVPETDIPFYQNTIDESAFQGAGDFVTVKDYMAAVKGKEGRVVYMTPDQYMKRVGEGFWSNLVAQQGSEEAAIQYAQKGGYKGNTKEEIIREMMDSRISDESLDRIQNFEKIYAPSLDYEPGSFSQEGHHRALYAKQEGIQKIPVVVTYPTGQAAAAGLKGKKSADLVAKLTDVWNRAHGIEPELPPKKFKHPTPVKLTTAQNRYAELLGLKELVEPLEIGKMELDLEKSKLDNQIDRAVIELKKLKTVTPEQMAVLLNTNIEAPASLGPEEKKVFDYFRALTRDILARTNQSREKLGREPIKDIGAYFRHVAQDNAEGMVGGRIPVPEKLKSWALTHVGKKIINPMELERKIKDELLKRFSNDLAFVMKSMVRTGLKEIHMDEPLKFFQDELAASQRDPEIYDILTPAEKIEYDKRIDMPADVKAWMVDYVNQALLDQQTMADKGANLWITDNEKLSAVLNAVLKPFGKQLGAKPFTNMLVAISKLPLYGVMGPFNPRQLLRNKMQTLQNIALYGVRNTVRGYFSTASHPLLEKIKTDSLFRKTYSGMEEMPVDIRGKYSKFHFALFQWTATSNVSQAMNSAFYWTLDKTVNPKWKGHGWADPQRTYNEPDGFLYPSELKKIKKEMEWGAQTTQFQYLGFAMPQIFRYKVLAPATRLQSWWMNYWSVFMREASTRAFYGHVGYDPSIKLSVGDRLGIIKYLMLAGAILNTLGYTRSFLFGTAPTGVPPALQVPVGLYIAATHGGSSTYEKNVRNQALRKVGDALKTFIPGYLTIKDLNALFRGRSNLKDFLFYNKSEADDFTL
jgi:hypothetical protein